MNSSVGSDHQKPNGDFKVEPPRENGVQKAKVAPASPLSLDNGDQEPASRLTNGDAGDPENESEAETVVLSKHDERPNGSLIKDERSDGDLNDIDNIPSSKDAPVETREVAHEDQLSQPASSPSTRSSDREEVPNGIKHKRISSETRAHSLPRAKTSGNKHKEDDSPPPQRSRRLSFAESKKRKERDDAHFQEPPRQRHKTERPDSLRHLPTSPAVKAHKRSASTQSILHGNNRKRREVSDSPSETSSLSPQPQHPNFHYQPRPKRSAHRSMTSPAKSNAPRKKRDSSGNTALGRACERGDMAGVKEALDRDPDTLNLGDNDGNTPLQKAALAGHEDIVEYLLKRGCDPHVSNNDRGDTPLIDAVENSNLAVVRILLEKGGVDPEYRNLNDKSAMDLVNDDEDDADEIRTLLEEAKSRRTSVSGQEGARNSARPQRERSPGLLSNEYNTETLRAKSAEGNLLAVGRLVQNNVKVNLGCGLAAARAGHDEVLSLLLASGLRPDPHPDRHSETPMLLAIERGYVKVVELLLQQEAFNPTFEPDRDGKRRTYFDLAEHRKGPRWQVIRDHLREAYDKYCAKHGMSPKARRRPKVPRPQGDLLPPSDRDKDPQARRKQINKESSPQPRRRRVIEESDDEEEPKTDNDGKPTKVRPVQQPPSKSSPVRVEKLRRESSSHDQKKAKRLSADLHDRPVKIKHEKSELSSKDPPTVVKKKRRSSLSSTADAMDIDAETPAKEAADKTKEERKRKVSQEDAEARKRAKAEAEQKEAEEQAAKEKAEKEKAEAAAAEAQKRKQEEEKAEAEAKRIEAEAAAKRKEEEEAAKRAEEQAARQAEEAAAAKRAEEARLAEEKAAAEAKRAEEEAAAAAKQAEEESARRAAEEQAAKEAAEKARVEHEQWLETLPCGLKRAYASGNSLPLHFKGLEAGISILFLPIYVVRRTHLDSNCSLEQQEEEWMLNFQAAGILGLDSLELKEFPEWLRLDATERHRDLLIKKGFDWTKLAQTKISLMPETQAEADHHRLLLQDTKSKFMNMQPLMWIRVDDFMKATTNYPHLDTIRHELASKRALIDLAERPSPSTFMEFIMSKAQTNGIREPDEPPKINGV